MKIHKHFFKTLKLFKNPEDSRTIKLNRPVCGIDNRVSIYQLSRPWKFVTCKTCLKKKK